MATPKRKRQTISIEIKKQIIDAAVADPKKSYADLATEFSNDRLTFTSENMKRIFRDKDKILNAIDDGISGKRARLTTGRYADLETAVLTWIRQVRSENVAVTGPLLKVRLLFHSKFTTLFRKRRSSWLKNWKSKISKQARDGWTISKSDIQSSSDPNKEKRPQLIWKSSKIGNRQFCVML